MRYQALDQTNKWVDGNAGAYRQSAIEGKANSFALVSRLSASA
jgi:hypothetical protein